CRGLDPYLPAPCRLKWPNDLMAGGQGGRPNRKIGGILVESTLQPGACSVALVGFGVNHGQTVAGLPVPNATSLALASPGGEPAVDLPRLTWELVAAVERELARAGEAGYAVAAYRERTVHRPGERLVARTGEETVEGRFAGFDEHGRLLLAR